MIAFTARRPLQPLQPLQWILLLFICMIVLPLPGYANTLFSVTDLAADVTADSALAAKEKAIVQSHRKAYDTLVKRLVLSDDIAKAKSATATQIAALVKSFEVSGERSSSVRYLADFTIHFRENAVNDFWLGKDIRFSASKSEKVLVLPVYRLGGKSHLWDQPNPWLQAWQQFAGKDGLVPVEVPLGDILDLNDLPVDEALSGNWSRIAKMLSRYQAGRAMITVASPDLSSSDAGLSVTISSFAQGHMEQTQILNVRAPVEEPSTESDETDLTDQSSLYQSAIRDVLAALEDDWKRRSQLSTGNAAQIEVESAINGLSDWLALKTTLEGIPLITGIEPLFVSQHGVRLRLNHAGGLHELRLALAQAGYDMDALYYESRDPSTGMRLNISRYHLKKNSGQSLAADPQPYQPNVNQPRNPQSRGGEGSLYRDTLTVPQNMPNNQRQDQPLNGPQSTIPPGYTATPYTPQQSMNPNQYGQ